MYADGGLDVATTDRAPIQMDSDPSQPAQLVSGWHTNTTFIRLTRFLDWELGHDDAISYIDLPAEGSPA